MYHRHSIVRIPTVRTHVHVCTSFSETRVQCTCYRPLTTLQLNYAEMLNRVDPLRRELQTLESQAETTRIKGDEINKIINELEASINKYKEEYALLISEANAIKADLETVEAKVCRDIYVFDNSYTAVHVYGFEVNKRLLVCFSNI